MINHDGLVRMGQDLCRKAFMDQSRYPEMLYDDVEKFIRDRKCHKEKNF
jgi:hypothetical protein